MKACIGPALFLSAAIGALTAGCTMAAAEERIERTAPHQVAGSSLEECARPDVLLGTVLKTSVIDRAAAQAASGVIGVRGDPAIALLTTVTIGTRTGSIATPADALVDARGSAIVDRPVWIFVYRDQAVKMPSGGPYVPGAVRASFPPPVSVLASIVDAQTGEFLRGWGCAFAS